MKAGFSDGAGNVALPTAGMPERWEKLKGVDLLETREVIYLFYFFMTFLKLKKKKVLEMERNRIQDR